MLRKWSCQQKSCNKTTCWIHSYCFTLTHGKCNRMWQIEKYNPCVNCWYIAIDAFYQLNVICEQPMVNSFNKIYWLDRSKWIISLSIMKTILYQWPGSFIRSIFDFHKREKYNRKQGTKTIPSFRLIIWIHKIQFQFQFIYMHNLNYFPHHKQINR